MSDEILFEKSKGWGIITLNRPKALNALTPGMVTAMRAQLLSWATDDDVHAVLVKAEGEKAFCAGGDIRWLHDNARDDVATARQFFRDEYTNNATIFHFPKPYVALIDGVVMGGGVGISVHGDFRIAGDRTLFAMPETGIGLFPDVGGGYFLPRLDGGLGLYFGLTGNRAKAADCVVAGIATHYVPSDKFAELENKLRAIDFGKGDPFDLIDTIIGNACQTVEGAGIEDNLELIHRCFADKPSLLAVREALQQDQDPFAAQLLETINRMSPTSLALTFEQIKRGGAMDFNDVMKMEFAIVWRVMAGHDFFEGVRALIIDKDKSPTWHPTSLEELSIDDIESHFNDLGDHRLVL